MSDIVVWWLVVQLVVGFFVAKVSLRMLRYPERYHWVAKFLLFPATMSVHDGDVRGILMGDSRDFSLMTLCGVDLYEISNDDPDCYRARFWYIVWSVILLPIRLAYLGLMLFCSCIIGTGTYLIRMAGDVLSGLRIFKL